MHRSDAPLSVALFATNDPRNYSGGRYLSLIMAYALASQGCRVTFYTDHLPSFNADLAELAPNRLRIVLTSDFRQGVAPEPADWVVLIPTGIFLPSFYDAVTDYAAAASARLLLVNFESANWYNATSPHPRDARLWEAWRHSCLDGALVLSIAREALPFARDFYTAPNAELRFDVWHPPINSPAAERCDGLPRRPLVVGFVRPSDPHKGGRDLLALPPGLLAGHELALVSGRDLDPVYLDELQRYFSPAADLRISVHTRISDDAKMRLLSEAKLLLFPSYFEGYGYPPIEALYCGTPVVCYDLPVLRETVGDVARFVAPGDNHGFAAAVAEVLARPVASAPLRDAVYRFAHFPSQAAALVDLLHRHADAVPRRQPPAFRISVGPQSGTRPRTPGPLDQPPLPAFPFHVIDARSLDDGQVALTARCASSVPVDRASASFDGQELPVWMLAEPEQPASGSAYRLHLVLPAGRPLGTELLVRLWQDSDHCVIEEALRLRESPPRAPGLPPEAGVLQLHRLAGQLSLHAWALAGMGVDHVAIALPSQPGWVDCSVAEERPELLERCGELDHCRAGFAVKLPIAELPTGGLDVLLIGGGLTLGQLRGWPGVAGGLRRSRWAPPRTQWITLASMNNSHWQQGISLFGESHAPSAFVTQDAAAAQLQPGTALRFAGGAVARLVRLDKKGTYWNAYVDRPLLPSLDGYPGQVEILPLRALPLDASLSFADSSPDCRGDWLNGVRVRRDTDCRRVVRLRADSDAAALLEPGAMLRFATAGLRTVLAVEEQDDALVVWLDAPVGPVRDGAPRALSLHSLPMPDDEWLLPLACESIAPRPADHDGQGRVWFEVGGAAERLAVGNVLHFAQAGPQAVVAISQDAIGLCATVAATLDPQRDCGAVHLMGPLRTALCEVDRKALHPVPNFSAPDPLHLQVARRWRTNQVTHAAATAPELLRRPRVLFLTLVPPTPANQGNRVVTRNLIAHLIEMGYDVDVLMQGWIDVPAFIEEFGERARLLHVGFPNWQDSDEARARRAAGHELKKGLTTPHQKLLDRLDEFHPFFIVRDEVVDRVRDLLQTTSYESVVCNYLHMARVVVELGAEQTLPRTCVITHDALSNLTRELEGRALNTMYRACSPEVERDALNSVPNGVAVAISADEQRYFQRIGVKLPIVLCEVDSMEEIGQNPADSGSFQSRRLIYSASGNPLNLAGLGWFLDECWPAVLAEVPEAELVISGPICEALPLELPGVRLVGNLERSALSALMREASIAINPCIVGTGLKIKTVEAACLGLPAVCLPAAVDGLQDIAQRFAITANDAAAFTSGCVALLTDAQRWQALHQGALEVARTRFSHERVYKELDAAMGWRAQTEWPVRVEPEQHGPELGAQAEDRQLRANPGALLRLRREQPNSPAVAIALAREMAEAGEFLFAHQLAEQAVAQALRNPYYTASASRLALQAGVPWVAALHAARLVAGPNGARPDGHALMGEALLALDRPEQALDALLQAAALATPQAALLEQIVLAAQKLGRHDLYAWALRQQRVAFELEQTHSVAAGSPGVALLARGWSKPEEWGVWTDGDTAVLSIEFPEPVLEDLEIVLVSHGFIPGAHRPQQVTASVAGRLIGAHAFTEAEFAWPWTMHCPASLLRHARRLELVLRIAQASSPAEIGLAADPRKLGLALHALRIGRSSGQALAA